MNRSENSVLVRTSPLNHHSSSLTQIWRYVDYIDLYLIHDPFSGKEKRLETYRALLDAQKQGKIHSVGVSNYGVHHLEEIRAAGYPVPSVNQIELQPYCQQRPIADYCAEHGIVVQAYSPLVRGRIAADDAIQRIARARADEGVDPFRILVRWSLQKGCVFNSPRVQ